MKQQMPNILLITCDQLRADFVGACGCDFVSTPSIDRLAMEGCTYTNAYSPNPVSIPARHNLLTGLTARYHGFDDNYFGAAAKSCPWYLPTFPQILNDNGYETTAIGKIHFQPERRATGFDFFQCIAEIPGSREMDDYAMYLEKVGYGNIQSVHGVRTCLYMQPQRSLVPQEHHNSAWVADRAIDYLNQNRGQRPFLMWAGFVHPHPPLNVPDEWADIYNGKIPEPYESKTPVSLLAEENKQLGCLENKEVLQRMRELYACAITFADKQIGRILDRLDELGLKENTLVVFTSDHGEMLGDMGTFQKFLPYDASAKIPLILRYPNGIEADTKRDDFADLNDLLPTFLDAAGVSYPASYDLPGESLLTGNGTKDRSYQYVEHQRGSKRWCSIRNRRYKYIYYYGDDEQLFDLCDDPHETTNLLYGQTDEQVLKIRDGLKNVLLKYEDRYGLEEYVKNGDFIQQNRYQIHPYYETNFPRYTKYLKPEEKENLIPYEDEILAAIRKEPSVKLDKNHTEEILKGWGGFSDRQIAGLFERADIQGNMEERKAPNEKEHMHLQ